MVRLRGSVCLMLACLFFMAGCSTTSNTRVGDDVHRFEPVPRVEVGSDELEPISEDRIADLLMEAEKAFQAANDAQEQGNFESATIQYTRMLELLIQADVDPAVFYNLRREFAQILDTTAVQAAIYEQGQPRTWTKEDFERVAVRGDLPIPDPLPDIVQQEIRKIQTVYADQFQRGLNRSVKYLPRIRHEFAKAGLPQDLVWLAIVESNFWPAATSRAGAGGMWQFMPATGKQYGLVVNEYVDERYNWEKSTRAAARFLGDLYDTFSNWPLAVTAYNSGPYGMERRMAMNGGERNLWQLISTPPASHATPRETKEYYAKFVASIVVCKNPEEYGFTITPEKTEPVMREPVRGSVRLADLNSQLGLPSGTLDALNPELRKEITPPQGEYALAVPAEYKDQLHAALQELPKKTQKPVEVAKERETGVRTLSHEVRRGETLSGIAQRYKTSYRAIQIANNISSPESIAVGQALSIPVSSSIVSASSRNNGTPRSYRVSRGDTLSSIADRFNVTVRQLQRWNNMEISSRIYVGQQINMYEGDGGEVTGNTGTSKVTHIVKRGDYPGKIAQQYGVKTDDLLRWNNLTRRSKIRVGQKLVVYAAGSTGGSGAGGSKIIHTVQKGDSPWTIASKYNVELSDFLAWNGLKKGKVLHVGDEYVVHTGKSGSPAQAQAQVHTVQRGENPTLIARRYGIELQELFNWNGWGKSPVLHPGTEIQVGP